VSTNHQEVGIQLFAKLKDLSGGIARQEVTDYLVSALRASFANMKIQVFSGILYCVGADHRGPSVSSAEVTSPKDMYQM
jgi:hypothetical protein